MISVSPASQGMRIRPPQLRFLDGDVFGPGHGDADMHFLSPTTSSAVYPTRVLVPCSPPTGNATRLGVHAAPQLLASTWVRRRPRQSTPKSEDQFLSCLSELSPASTSASTDSGSRGEGPFFHCHSPHVWFNDAKVEVHPISPCWATCCSRAVYKCSTPTRPRAAWALVPQPPQPRTTLLVPRPPPGPPTPRALVARFPARGIASLMAVATVPTCRCQPVSGLQREAAHVAVLYKAVNTLPAS